MASFFKNSRPFGLIVALMLLSASLFSQEKPAKPSPTDQELKSLAGKYVKSPIKRVVKANGDVFLQRNMSDYLHANLNKVEEQPGTADHGHDHKDAQLEEFLNRPHPSVATLNKYFLAAAKTYKVPVDLLKAIGQVQSNWAQVGESMYGSWGIMGIIENKRVKQISLAAKLLKTTAADIKNNARANINAAAALLAYYQKGQPAATSPEGWFLAVKELTGLSDEAMKTELAQRFYEVMKTGSKTVSLWGEIITLEPRSEVGIPREKTTRKAGENSLPQDLTSVNHPLAIPNYTTCNFGTRPAGSGINYYFVHYVATGTYQGAISWFKDCASQVSAHYVVRNSDGQISQVVDENDRAWSQGVTAYNDQGIGIEHEVLATNLSMWDSEPMLNAAGRLCADVCNRRSIPKTRRVTNGERGIYGHSDVKSTDCPNMTQARWDVFFGKVLGAGPSVGAPTLYGISNPGTGTSVTAIWNANAEPTLAGYRLYYATDDGLGTWALAANETTLTATTTTVTLSASEFLVPPAGDVYHFKLTAVVTDGTNANVESGPSDIYSRSGNVSGPKMLIVDGFDRTSGSYTSISHPFVTSYFKAVRDRGLVQVNSAANERVEDGSINLADYNMVIWFTGDESSANVVFSAAEKTKLSAYLTNGGKLLISGSEIAYNIGRSAAAAYDLSFMNNYLKAGYVGDGAISYTPATGVAGTDFAGLTIPFGITYVEDFPDDILATGGATDIFNYAVSNKRGGVAYKGNFGSGTTPGAVIYLSFTLETAADASISAFIASALPYFGVAPIPLAPTATNDAATAESGISKRLNLLANDNANGTALDAATLVLAVPPLKGTAVIEGNGEVTYRSNPGFTGADNFQYRVKNTSGQWSNTATVTVTVVPAAACSSAGPEVDDNYPIRDLRGAWVSTVSNIDWPSSRTLTTAQQQAELLKILDTLSATGINTVFLQIRPECDALYASSYDPWSYWLTNAQGTAPNPAWDPLQFALDQAHGRGMELHAWINPYRAKQSTPVLAAGHVASLHPDWTFLSGSITLLNPGLPEVRQYLTSVIADVASRYDVDGIHFDDYFYPYAGMSGQDDATFAAYNPAGIATIEDWRRNNINQLIGMVYDTLQKINTQYNKNVVFGVSPFGIWKSGTPAGISGTSSYSQIFCDPIAWLQAGKVDYVAPQLYWKLTGAQDYYALSKWWNDQALLYGRHAYPGLALYKMTDANNWETTEIQNQIITNRAATHAQVLGQILFSTKQIMANSKTLKTALQNNQFRYKSFAPPMPWRDAVCPNMPTNLRWDADSLRWDSPAAAADGDQPVKYVVYAFANAAEAATAARDGKKVRAIVAANMWGLSAGENRNAYIVVTAIDKNNNESETSSGIVLPLTGFSFDALLVGKTGVLQWSTLSETNTQSFHIERSNDGSHFTSLGTVNAAGNSQTPKKYSWVDNNLQAGANYYRIKTTDLNGATRYSAVKTIQWSRGGPGIVVGPNPFTNSLTISRLVNAESVALMDANGRVLLRKTAKNVNGISLTVPEIPVGLYFLKITMINGEASMIKLIKDR